MLRGLVESRLLRLPGGFLFVASIGLTVVLLTVGRDALKTVGLSHNVSGAIATVLTVALIVAGLAYFAINVIDWE